MLRKTVLAIATTAVIGAAALTPTAASAKGGFNHHHFGGFGGFGGGFFQTVVDTSAWDSCYRYRWVETRHGRVIRVRVNVCD